MKKSLKFHRKLIFHFFPSFSGQFEKDQYAGRILREIWKKVK